jgi:hypothetical protein
MFLLGWPCWGKVLIGDKNMKKGSWGKMDMVGLYDGFDRKPMPQNAVKVRGQKVCEMGIPPLYTLAGNKPWSWKI